MMANTDLVGFAPDADPTTPGVVLDCKQLLPTVRGMRAAPTLQDVGLPPLADECTGAATVVLLDDSRRTFAGTATAIYEQLGLTWQDVSRDDGTVARVQLNFSGKIGAERPVVPFDWATPRGAIVPYTGGPESRWRFAQFGNASLASNGADVIQESIGSGPFADIPGAPKAKIIATTNGFVFAFDTDDAVNGERPNGWACCALYNESDWAPDIATQAANGIMIDTPGGIKAGLAVGSEMAAYKATSLYFGTYQGPPVIWAWAVVSSNIGAPCQEAVISIGSSHLFLGNDNFYQFDGTRPVPIGDQVKEWFFRNRAPAYADKVQNMHDQANSLVYWFFVSANSTTGDIDTGLVFNYRNGRWGRADYDPVATMQYINGKITYDNLGALYATYDDLPKISYDSSFWTATEQLPAIIGPDGKLYTLTGIPTQSEATTSFFGDDEGYSDFQYMRVRFITDPTSATMDTTHRDTLGGAVNSKGKTGLFDGKFDVDVSDRWHAAHFVFQGPHEWLGYQPKLVPDGEA